MLKDKGYTRVRALLGGWEAWMQSGGDVEEAGAVTKNDDTRETQRVASPNPSVDFQGKPPDGADAPGLRGTAGTAQGATAAAAAGTPAKKAPKRRTKRRRSGT